MEVNVYTCGTCVERTPAPVADQQSPEQTPRQYTRYSLESSNRATHMAKLTNSPNLVPWTTDEHLIGNFGGCVTLPNNGLGP
jgi:hypothetical protein